MTHPQKLRIATLAVLLVAACDRDPTSGEGRPRFASVSAGGQSTCALTTEGEAYCWGNLASGQGGDTVPTEVPRKVAGGIRFRSIHGGSCGLDPQGALYCWNGAGAMPQFPDARFTAIAPHPTRFSCGVLTDGSVDCWGENASVVTSVGSNGRSRGAVPEAFREVSVGGYLVGEGGSRPVVPTGHACGVTVTGQGYCWGDNSRGQLGTGDTARASTRPLRVAGNLSFRTIQAGPVSTCALDAGGALYCWGNGPRTPQPVAAGLRFESLDVGTGHACAVAADGQAYCWGANSQGELGTGRAGFAAAPEAVAGSTRFKSVSVSSNSYHERIGPLGVGHTCAVGQDERIYCWGDNSRGQLGRPGRVSSNVPLPTD